MGFKVEHLRRLLIALDAVHEVIGHGTAVAGEIADDPQMVVVHVHGRDKHLDERLPVLRIRGIPGAEPLQPEGQLVTRQLRLLDLLLVDRILQIEAPALQFFEALLRAGRDDALLDGLQNVRDPALRLRELRLQPAEDAVVPLAFLKLQSCVDDHPDHLVSQAALTRLAHDGLLDPVLLDWLFVACLLALPLDACVIVPFAAAFTGAALAHHGAAAVPAEQLPGEHIVHISPGSCRSSGDLLQTILHCFKQLPRNNCRNAALDPDVLPDIHACIPLIPENGVQAIFIEPSAARRSEPAAVQHADDLRHVRAVRVHLEDLPDDGRLGRLDRVPAVWALHVTERQAAVVYFAGQSVVVHAPEYVLREVRAVILGRAFEHGLQQDPLRALRDRLHDAHDFDAVLLQAGLIGRAVVPVPGKAVDLIHEDALPVPLGGVPDHLQELRALI